MNVKMNGEGEFIIQQWEMLDEVAVYALGHSPVTVVLWLERFIVDDQSGEPGLSCHPLRVLRYPCVGRIRFQFVSLSHNGSRQATHIINSHLRGDRDILMCQDELIDAGLAEWARL